MLIIYNDRDDWGTFHFSCVLITLNLAWQKPFVKNEIGRIFLEWLQGLTYLSIAHVFINRKKASGSNRFPLICRLFSWAFTLAYACLKRNVEEGTQRPTSPLICRLPLSELMEWYWCPVSTKDGVVLFAVGLPLFDSHNVASLSDVVELERWRFIWRSGSHSNSLSTILSLVDTFSTNRLSVRSTRNCEALPERM